MNKRLSDIFFSFFLFYLHVYIDMMFLLNAAIFFSCYNVARVDHNRVDDIIIFVFECYADVKLLHL